MQHKSGEEVLFKAKNGTANWEVRINYDDSFIEINANDQEVSQSDFQSIVKLILATEIRKFLFYGPLLNSDQLISLSVQLKTVTDISCFILFPDIKKNFNPPLYGIVFEPHPLENAYKSAIVWLTNNEGKGAPIGDSSAEVSEDLSFLDTKSAWKKFDSVKETEVVDEELY